MKGVGLHCFTLLVLVGLFACSPARFVPPEEKPREYVPGGIGNPRVVEKTRQVVKWREAMGDLNLVFLVQVNSENEARFFERLRQIFSGLGEGDLLFPNLPPLTSFSSIRVNFVLEKRNPLSAAKTRWRTFTPQIQTSEVIRAGFDVEINQLEATYRAEKANAYLDDPFASFEEVVRSLKPDRTVNPSFLHLVYLRDRDLFFEPGETKQSRERLLAVAQQRYFSAPLLTVSLFSYLNRNSVCRPSVSDLGLKITRHFAGLEGARSELCDLPASALRELAEAWTAGQGRVLLRETPVVSSLDVKVDGLAARAGQYQYNPATRELSFLRSAEPRVGAVIEVGYEVAR